MLNRAPDGKTDDNGVMFQHYDPEGEVIVEHTITSATQLTRADVKLPGYLLEHVDDENNDCTNWYGVTWQTRVRLKLYNRFYVVFFRHTIADLELSVDEMVSANQKLVKAAEYEAAEIRSGLKKKEAEKKLAAEIASAVLPE